MLAEPWLLDNRLTAETHPYAREYPESPPRVPREYPGSTPRVRRLLVPVAQLCMRPVPPAHVSLPCIVAGLALLRVPANPSQVVAGIELASVAHGTRGLHHEHREYRSRTL